jgi:hypothetical protein
MLNLCGIVVAILKMATGRNFSMSGHHYLPTYKNFDDIHSDRSPLEEQFCVFNIFEMSAIFKMVAKTWHKKCHVYRPNGTKWRNFIEDLT